MYSGSAGSRRELTVLLNAPHLIIAVAAPSTETPESITEKDVLPIGYLSKAHGIRGELVLVLTARSPEAVQGTLYLRHKNGGPFRPVGLCGKRTHHGSLLVSFEGVRTRNEAELLRSHTVFVARSELPPLDEDEFFLADLVGLNVLTVSSTGEERELGVIENAAAPAGQILWTIRSSDDVEILFPAVEEFVLSIDFDENIARISPPPGLLDLYLGRS